jgi:hypothetical protein
MVNKRTTQQSWTVLGQTLWQCACHAWLLLCRDLQLRRVPLLGWLLLAYLACGCYVWLYNALVMPVEHELLRLVLLVLHGPHYSLATFQLAAEMLWTLARFVWLALMCCLNPAACK